MAPAQPDYRNLGALIALPERDSRDASYARRLRTPAFVSAHLIRDVPAAVLAVALHRDRAGIHRPGCSPERLVAALRSGNIACDPLTIRWLPPPGRTHAFMWATWGRSTGYEGPAHRCLRGAAAVLLAAWFPGAEVEAERPVYAHGRCVRPDLLVHGPDGRGVVAEVGTVKSDAVFTLLKATDCRPACDSVSHVVALPFAGQGATVTRGYVFRLACTAALGAPGTTALRTAWKALQRQAVVPGNVP